MTEVDVRVVVDVEPLELPELGGGGGPPEELDAPEVPPLLLLLPMTVTGASVGGPMVGGLLGPCKGVVVSFAVYEEH